MAEAFLYVDGSEVFALAERLGACMTSTKFDSLMRKALKETGEHLKDTVKDAIQEEYYASASWIYRSIGKPRIYGGGGNMYSITPITSEKGRIGGEFAASGGYPGWGPGGSPPPAYKIRVKIVKGEISELPRNMTHQGGKPPYRNTGPSTYTRTIHKKSGEIVKDVRRRKPPSPKKFTMDRKKGGGFLTRAGNSKYPVEPMSALAIPQMAVNRGRRMAETRIAAKLESRVIHYFSGIFD